MKKHILILLLSALLMLCVSCETILGIEYLQPSNINMAQYRSVAIASAQAYEGRQNIPFYIRYLDAYDTSLPYFDSTYSYDSINRTAAGELTKMVTKVFGDSSYYSVLSPERTDTYISLYRVGRDPSAMLKEDGIDALIVPKITSLKTDEYIDLDEVTDYYTGEVSYIYTLYRYVSIKYTLTVLDTATNRIVAVKEYSAEDVTSEVFDPDYYIFYSIMSESDLVSDVISDTKSTVKSDFIPSRRYAYVSLKNNRPKVEGVEEAYKAAENGNYDYALTLFRNEYESSGHLPSGYNAAVILAAQGNTESALELLGEIRSSGRADSDVNSLYSQLVDLKKRTEEARKQLTSAAESASSQAASPYEYLF